MKLKTNDYVLITNKQKPLNIPRWTPSMDQYLGKATQVTHVNKLNKKLTLYTLKIDNGEYRWSSRWLKKISKQQYTAHQI